MECIEELQSSHRRLCSLYNNLYNNQRLIVSHELGIGQDLSNTSLLKFAPIAENFQSYADDYKKELSNFQNLLNTVQQTVKKINIKSNNNMNNNMNINGKLNGNMMMTRDHNIDDHKALSNDLNASYTSYYNMNANNTRKNAPNPNPNPNPPNINALDDITQYDHIKDMEIKTVTIPYDSNANTNTNTNTDVLTEEKDIDIDSAESLKQRRKAKKKAKKRAKKRCKDLESEKELSISDNKVMVLNDDELFLSNMDHQIDFKVDDSREIHEEDQEYQLQRKEMQQRDELANAYQPHAHDDDYDVENTVTMPSISYESIVKENCNKNTYCCKNTFDMFDGREMYTSTMLRLTGSYGLREDNEDDKQLVKDIMVKEIKFKEEHIENIQIRNARNWCIVYVRCCMKFIRDRIKKLEQKNKKLSNDKVMYRLIQYQRRRNLTQFKQQNQSVAESNKLYILNFDVLNKNCHKALTNLFLKFGDLADDIQIGINSRNDPFAKVLYKNINDAKTLWNYQNFNCCPHHKKIIFGSRELTIQYARY